MAKSSTPSRPRTASWVGTGYLKEARRVAAYEFSWRSHARLYAVAAPRLYSSARATLISAERATEAGRVIRLGEPSQDQLCTTPGRASRRGTARSGSDRASPSRNHARPFRRALPRSGPFLGEGVGGVVDHGSKISRSRTIRRGTCRASCLGDWQDTKAVPPDTS